MAVVEPKQVFGLSADVEDNVCYLDEQHIVYPAGSTLVIYNVETREQRFIPGTEGNRGFSSMAVSPNRRYIAVAEKRAEAPVVLIFDLHTLKKRKNLMHTELHCDEFVSMAFSPDSKYLVTLGGAPDWGMLYWSWEKSRGPMASTRVSSGDAAVYSVTFNPHDNTQICVVGDGILKTFRYQDGNLKTLVQVKMAEPQNFLSQAWVSETQVVVGTDQNTVMLFEGQELKAEFVVHGENKSDGFRIEAVAAYSLGFICAGAHGTMAVFNAVDEVEEKEFFQRVDISQVSEDTNSFQIIKNLAISPSERNLLATTDKQQLYTARMLSASREGDAADDDSYVAGLHLLIPANHHGAVTDVSVALRKPLAATCSSDGSIRVWDYTTDKLELKKYFQEAGHAISMHPSGLHLLVGFSDKLRLLNILMDDIRTFHEFNIRNCDECQFSHGGDRFAAVNGNTIEVYSTYSFHQVGSLKGHNGKVRSVAWSLDDTRITTCGLDGAVYVWDSQTGDRVGENVLKSCGYNCVAPSPDGKNIFAVGSDKTLKQIRDNTIVEEIPSINKFSPVETTLTQVVVSSNGRMVLAATESGTIRAVKYPLTTPWEGSSLPTHCGAVKKLRMSPDDQYLFSVGVDGCVMVYKLSDKEGRGIKHKEQEWADEILITKTDLEEKNTMLIEKETQVRELKIFNDYQLELKEMSHRDAVKASTAKYESEIEALEARLQMLQSEKDKDESKHDETVGNLVDGHTRQLMDLEHTQNQKLLEEYTKYKDLQLKAQNMQEKCERQLAEMEHTKARALEDLAEFWENKLLEVKSQLEGANTNAMDKQKEYQETRRQIELDADQEILSLKNQYEHRLKEAQETAMRLQGDNGILRKKYKTLARDIEAAKSKREVMEAEQQKLLAHIRALEKDISSGKKEIAERDETIQDKEKRIYDLKKKNQELEKFKFVLDYKIKELKKQIEPRENEIKEMRTQIAQMDEELQQYYAQTTKLTLQIESLEQKLGVANKENASAHTHIATLEQSALRIRSDLQLASQLVSEPKHLAHKVRSMYKTYCEKQVNYTTTVDEDVQREANRQREFLEHTARGLRSKLDATKKNHEEDVTRIMRENQVLIREINQLRQELRLTKGESVNLEATLKTTLKLSEMRGTKLPDLTEKFAATQTLRDRLDDESAEKIIQMQKNEIRKLRTTITSLESTQRDRPHSSEIRLKPLDLTDASLVDAV